MKLKSIFASVQKSSDKWSRYLDIYEESFKAFRKKKISFLEIGVQNGGFTELLAKYFLEAEKIVGCDVSPLCGDLKFDDPRISIIVGDASSAQTAASIKEVCDAYDIILDDASHKSSEIIRSFCLYFPMLKTDGLYVIEDLHAGYWRDFGGGLVDTASSLSFFKLLTDVINHQHWGVDMSRMALLAPFFALYNCTIDEADLASIASVQFVNSMVIIQKNAASATLGKRRITGTIALVSDNTSYNGVDPITPNQQGNPLAHVALAADTRRPLILNELVDLCSQLRDQIALSGAALHELQLKFDALSIESRKEEVAEPLTEVVAEENVDQAPPKSGKTKRRAD
jgi:hypothetical protein